LTFSEFMSVDDDDELDHSVIKNGLEEDLVF
jgi:hypothetical protein